LVCSRVNRDENVVDRVPFITWDNTERGERVVGTLSVHSLENRL
jgi:hypothetical protein